AAPPDWDTRFLAHALEDVAHAAVKVLVAADPGGTRWRDAATLAAVRAGAVARAVRGAELLVEAGDPATFARVASRGAVLLWSPGRRQEGEWYLQPPAASPIAGALAGVAWDSLPPVTALGELAPSSPSDSSPAIALTARLARRGPPRAVIALSQRAGKRRATIAAGRLYRGAFRGVAGAAAEGPERGLVAVDTYSDEWRPAPVVVAPQPGATVGRLAGVALRDRWWLFVAAIAAFAGEWAWRRRQGLP